MLRVGGLICFWILVFGFGVVGRSCGKGCWDVKFTCVLDGIGLIGRMGLILFLGVAWVWKRNLRLGSYVFQAFKLEMSD